MPPQAFQTLLQHSTAIDLVNYLTSWRNFARADQIAPEGDWLIWLLLGGRGSGKTRAGAEWIREQVAAGVGRIALVAPTLGSAREVMIEGESGLRQIGLPSERPEYISSRRRLEWPNGAIAQIFSAEDPDSLRGPQFECAWADEFCAWSRCEDTLSNLRLGLRLGQFPRLVVTTTPKPTASLKQLMNSQGIVISQMKSQDNTAFLSSGFLDVMKQSYGGSVLGRQELDGEFIEDLPGALWSRAQLDQCRMSDIAEYDKIIIAVDPPVTSHKTSDSCGIIIAGKIGQGRHSRAYILADETQQGLTPEAWAAYIIGLHDAWDAQYILVETNQGGDLVKTIIQMIDPNVIVRSVFARSGKTSRAEPVAALYSQNRVVHIGKDLSALEDEMCLLGTGHLHKSPDRADAMVWAVTDLLLGQDKDLSIRPL